jgi:hypothetical protein
MDSSSTTLLTTLRALRESDVALAISNLSAYHIAFDRWHEARIHAREALEAARVARQYAQVALMLQHLAAVAILAPAPQHDNPAAQKRLAAVLLGYVDRYSARVGASRSHIERQGYERALNRLRETLPSVQLQELMANGSTITLDEAIALALSV